MILSHINAVKLVSDLVTSIVDSAGNMIESEILAGRRLPVVALSERISNEFQLDKMFCYQIITRYIIARGDLRIKKGPGGGIEKIPVEVSEDKKEI